MAGPRANWMWTVCMVALFGLNAYFLYQWARGSGGKLSQSPEGAGPDGRFKVQIAHLILIHVSLDE